MILKSKGKDQKAKGKRAALDFSFDKSGAAFRVNFCLLIFAFCLLLSPTRAQERINLNTASAEQLMRLPYVGNAVAHRILEHRRKHGIFKRPQDLIVIKGLSAKRYRQIAHLICI